MASEARACLADVSRHSGSKQNLLREIGLDKPESTLQEIEPLLSREKLVASSVNE